MMRNSRSSISIAWLLLTTAAVADTLSGPALIGPTDGLSFGQSPHAVAWLQASDPMPAACAQETRYYVADANRRGFLAEVRLKAPGLVYRFIQDRLYAVQAEFPSSQNSFATLGNYLTARYGAPDVTESWQEYPADTYVYRNRLQTMGWYGADRTYSIWLTNGNAGGSIIMVENGLADAGLQLIGKRCAVGGMDIAEAAP
ncbi:MAG: hypothetical protein KDI82_01340 [Gammaproteobacteria bacterium]|nr:hypothetical protein [Gammaproteobacteria bacterium]